MRGCVGFHILELGRKIERGGAAEGAAARRGALGFGLTPRLPPAILQLLLRRTARTAGGAGELRGNDKGKNKKK